MNRPRERSLAFSICVILVLVCTPQGQTADQQIATQVDALLKRAVIEGFGGAVVIDRNGKTVLSAGYGFASRQARSPFTSDTIAPIGSIIGRRVPVLFTWWPDQQTFMYFVGNNGEEAVRPVLGSVIDTIQTANTPR